MHITKRYHDAAGAANKTIVQLPCHRSCIDNHGLAACKQGIHTEATASLEAVVEGRAIGSLEGLSSSLLIELA